jgi:hypothetical protein
MSRDIELFSRSYPKLPFRRRCLGTAACAAASSVDIDAAVVDDTTRVTVNCGHGRSATRPIEMQLCATEVLPQ